jgi:hypothetical protein
MELHEDRVVLRPLADEHPSALVELGRGPELAR